MVKIKDNLAELEKNLDICRGLAAKNPNSSNLMKLISICHQLNLHEEEFLNYEKLYQQLQNEDEQKIEEIILRVNEEKFTDFLILSKSVDFIEKAFIERIEYWLEREIRDNQFSEDFVDILKGDKGLTDKVRKKIKCKLERKKDNFKTLFFSEKFDNSIYVFKMIKDIVNFL
ncbi:hypothetical protein JXR93_12255 [bacterium]|nr:hypothetical protein [bacterium]